ncbi:hypothetical protein Tco_1568073 [Tanacetum coccineum]
MESTVDITKLFRKLKFICHWANPFKDFERSNVLGIKLSSFSESDDTFTSLQALSNLHYLFSGFMDYLWSLGDVQFLLLQSWRGQHEVLDYQLSVQEIARYESINHTGRTGIQLLFLGNSRYSQIFAALLCYESR